MAVTGNAVKTKTLRVAGQWVKITRNRDQKSWTFARGHKGQLIAHDVSSYPFAYMPTWACAIEHAQSQLAVHA